MRLAFVDDDYGEIKKLTTMIDKELHGTVYSSCTKQLFSTGETFLSVWKPVSYTHLDVYKRQSKTLSIKGKHNIFFIKIR